MRIFFKYLFLIFIFLSGFFIWKNTAIPKTTGLSNEKLYPCPKSPNCVNDLAVDKRHAIEPLVYISENTLEQIRDYLTKYYDARILCSSSTYLHVVITTNVWRFKDDLEFLVDRENKIIHVRSASRVGYSDMGVNRKRIEKLRQFINI